MTDIWKAVNFVKVHPEAELPAYKSFGASGMDLCAVEGFTLHPGERKLVDTGFKMELPPNMEAQIRPRSGLALKYGVTVLNSPGTIDSDYRGTVGVILLNTSPDPVMFKAKDRIAQMVVATVEKVFAQWTESLHDSERGTGGFGSTGT